MMRILIALGSILLEVATTLSEGALAVSMMIAGMIVTVLHLTLESSPFQKTINRLTGFDLPECLDPARTTASDEDSHQPT